MLDLAGERTSQRIGCLMIHYTCDRCKRAIDTALQMRHVVKIEVKAIVDDLTEDFEDEVDHLSELHQLLEGMGDEGDPCDLADMALRGRYDLCPDCYRQFVKNPLGRDALLALGFSNN